jgi:serine phosphatase RsbU (regulator of sigma subunit)
VIEQPQAHEDPPSASELKARRRRSDAEQNFSRIVESAVRLFKEDGDVSVDDVAAAAEVSRATVYRHFGSRRELVAAAQRQAREQADANVRDALRPAGELAASGPAPLDVADVLNKVPPHLVADQIVAEGQRIAQGASVALYLVDIDGSRLLRHAGSQEFPEELPAPLAVGPEIPRDGLPGLRRLIDELLPGTVPAPMFLRGRAIGLLLAIDTPEEPLLALARQAAAALELAASYTDVLGIARRRKATSPAAEVQQNLLPPRVARISGAALAGNVVPSYEVGGDWFDYVDNDDGAWIGIADATGIGPTAAALGAIALGAFRSARRGGADLTETVQAIHDVVVEVGAPEKHVAATIARWHGPSSTVTWITRGAPTPLLVHPAGKCEPLEHSSTPPLGAPGALDLVVLRHHLRPGERFVLFSDGVIKRRAEDGEELGLHGICAALNRAGGSAASTVRAITDAVGEASSHPLDDDAAVVVLTPTQPS